MLPDGIAQRVFQVMLDVGVDGQPQAVPLGGEALGLIALFQRVAPGVDGGEHHAVFPGEQVVVFQLQPRDTGVVHIGETQHRGQKLPLRVPAPGVLVDPDAGDAVLLAEIPHPVGHGTVHPVAEQAVVGAPLAEFFQQGGFVQLQYFRKALGGKAEFFLRHLPGRGPQGPAAAVGGQQNTVRTVDAAPVRRDDGIPQLLAQRPLSVPIRGAQLQPEQTERQPGGHGTEQHGHQPCPLAECPLGQSARTGHEHHLLLPLYAGRSDYYSPFLRTISTREELPMLHNETIRPTPRHRLRLPLRQLPAMDLPFLVLVLTLVGFGLVMLASASSAVALYRRGDAWAYLRPQLLYAALGLVGLWLASRVDYHIFHKLAWPLLALSLVLLVAVLFMPEYNGCKRWLVLPGLGTLQPSEIAKFAVVLVFSHVISLNHDQMKRFSVGVLPFALVLGVVAALMLLEPHLSGTLLILGIGAVLMFVGGTGLKWFVLAGVSGVAAIGAAVVIMPDLVPYAADRLNSWLDPFADPLGDGHQTIQSLYAIGSGGAAGLGLGNSRQKHLFVPEPQNDFIFSIVCEELGFVGACAVVGLFVLLLWRGITLAAHAPDRFGALLVVGFTVQVALQAVLNMAVVTNTIPNTGISLPFFSSGGTSLMMLLGEMGVVLSVSRGET